MFPPHCVQAPTSNASPEPIVAKKKRIPHKFQPWIDARNNFKLSAAHIQMARELGLSPKRFGKYANRKEEPWKLPLKEFIETLYEKQFNRSGPEKVMTIEEMAAEHVAKREAKKAAKAAKANEIEKQEILEKSSQDDTSQDDAS
jgi:hypothetical protein